MKYCISAINTWSRTNIESLSETWSQSLHNTGLKILECTPMSQIVVTMIFININSAQVGLVMNLVNGSMSLHFFVLNYILHNVVSITDIDT